MLYRNLFTLAFVFILAGLYAHGDEVWIKGEKKTAKGTIKTESSKEVVVQSGKQALTYPGVDVLDVFYENVKPSKLTLSNGEYKIAFNAEKEANAATDPAKKKAAYKKALDNYRLTLKEMAEAVKLSDPKVYQNATRHIRYRMAMIAYEQAVNDGSPVAAVVAELQAIKPVVVGNWQIHRVMPLIAKLQVESKDFKGAGETFAEMAEMKDLPDDVRAAADLKGVEVSLSAGNIALTNKKLEALAEKARAGKNEVLAGRVKVIKAELLVGQKKYKEAAKDLRDILKETAHPQIKALAHNALGECLFKDNLYSEAMWEFLWVDTVYNQDKTQRAKALYYLWRTFDQLNNAERGQECRQMLLDDPQFADTEYQRLAAGKAK